MRQRPCECVFFFLAILTTSLDAREKTLVEQTYDGYVVSYSEKCKAIIDRFNDEEKNVIKATEDAKDCCLKNLPSECAPICNYRYLNGTVIIKTVNPGLFAWKTLIQWLIPTSKCMLYDMDNFASCAVGQKPMIACLRVSEKFRPNESEIHCRPLLEGTPAELTLSVLFSCPRTIQHIAGCPNQLERRFKRILRTKKGNADDYHILRTYFAIADPEFVIDVDNLIEDAVTIINMTRGILITAADDTVNSEDRERIKKLIEKFNGPVDEITKADVHEGLDIAKNYAKPRAIRKVRKYVPEIIMFLRILGPAGVLDKLGPIPTLSSKPD